MNFICNLEYISGFFLKRDTAFTMSELEVILEYKGEIDFETIDQLLERLKKLPEYQETKLPVRKRIYCIFVECIENNYNHSIKDSLYVSDKTMVPYITLGKQDDHYIISTGNVIINKSIKKLRSRLEQINQLDKAGIKKSYAEIINKESISESIKLKNLQNSGKVSSTQNNSSFFSQPNPMGMGTNDPRLLGTEPQSHKTSTDYAHQLFYAIGDDDVEGAR